MALIAGGTYVEAVIANGVTIEKVIANGATVWELIDLTVTVGIGFQTYGYQVSILGSVLPTTLRGEPLEQISVNDGTGNFTFRIATASLPVDFITALDVDGYGILRSADATYLTSVPESYTIWRWAVGGVVPAWETAGFTPLVRVIG